MKWSLFLLLGLLAAAIGAIVTAAGEEAHPDPAAAPAMRVLSANVRFGAAEDGDHAWGQRSEFAMEALLAAKPDILGLQEALDFQVEAIRRAFPGHALIGEGRDGNGEGEWCALLVDSQRFAVRASGTYRLSPNDEVGAMGWDAACTRIVTWAELVDRHLPKAPFLILNAHFDHEGQVARRKSAELIAEWCEARRGVRGRVPVVLMGDLNAVEDSPSLVLLKGAGLRDTLRVLYPDAKAVGTFHGFRGGRDGRRIDYVLATAPWRVEDAWIDWTEAENRYPSDHRFVGATLSRAR